MFFIVIGLMVASSLTGGVLSQEALADDMELVAEASMLPEGEYSGAVSDGLDTYPITLSITDGNAFAVITNDNTHEYLCTLGKAIVTDQYEVLFTEFKFDNTLTWSTDSGSGTSLGAGGIYAVLYGRITNTRTNQSA